MVQRVEKLTTKSGDLSSILEPIYSVRRQTTHKSSSDTHTKFKKKKTHTHNNNHYKRDSGGWRDGSVVKSIGCSSKGLGFNFQHPHGSSQQFATSVPGVLTLSHRHACKQNTN